MIFGGRRRRRETKEQFDDAVQKMARRKAAKVQADIHALARKVRETDEVVQALKMWPA